MGVAARDQLLERDEELAALAELLEQARQGEGRVVVLEGAAGIGKTRLLHVARDAATEAGMRVLTARGTELERDFPFALVHQLFEPALHVLDPGARDELLAGAAQPAAPVVGIGTAPAGASAPADASFATLNALYWLTSNLAESAPALLAVDDVHWADKASLRFFRFLAPRLEDLPVLLALAARPSEPGADSELLDQLAADPVASVLRLRALSPIAVAELVRSQLSGAADDEFCAASHEATAGNPFLLRELLVELKIQGRAGTAREARDVRELAPATIQRAVLVRLARLPDDAVRLARAVAVLGDDAEPRHAGMLAELDRGAGSRATDTLVAAGILERGRPLHFAHPLVRNAVYVDLPGADKESAHRAAAALLERAGAEPERVALHLLATEPGGDARVVETLARATQRARARRARGGDRLRAARAGRAARSRAPTRAAVAAGQGRGSRRRPGRTRGSRVRGLGGADRRAADADGVGARADDLARRSRASRGRLALLERAKAAALEAGTTTSSCCSSHTTRSHRPPGPAGWERHRDRIAPGPRPSDCSWSWKPGAPSASASPPRPWRTSCGARSTTEGSSTGSPPSTRSAPRHTCSSAPMSSTPRSVRSTSSPRPRTLGIDARDRGGKGLRGGLAAARGDLTQAEPDGRRPSRRSVRPASC